jgi:hypothetical protein
VWDVFQEARARGYDAEFPHLFFMQKISHGDRLALYAVVRTAKPAPEMLPGMSQ